MRSWKVFIIWSIVLKTVVALTQVKFKYHNYDQMTLVLKSINKQHPDLTRLYTIGKSVQGRELWVLMIASNPRQDILLRPNVKYVANMHGNEAVGRELMLHLAAYLVNNYSLDPFVRSLLDNTKIHLMPSMNPDGFEISTEGQCVSGHGRYNARGFDLNRNFPDYFKSNQKQIQPETRAIRSWLERVPFVLSGNFHGGALVASYPFDNSGRPPFSGHSLPSPTPDNDVFQHLALVYSLGHRSMHHGAACRDGSPGFPNGTTNGAAWYPLTGGMQDYNYVWSGCLEITFEISCCKYPPVQRLPFFWNENKDALLGYMGQVHRGVKGKIVDINNNPIPKATMKIKGRDITFRTSNLGEYWRILLPGHYTIEVNAPGYTSISHPFTVNQGSVTILNLTLYQQQKVEEVTEHTWHLFFNEPTRTDATITDQATTVNCTNSSDTDSLTYGLTKSITEPLTTPSTQEPVARAVAESGTNSSEGIIFSIWILIIEILLLMI